MPFMRVRRIAKSDY